MSCNRLLCYRIIIEQLRRSSSSRLDSYAILLCALHQSLLGSLEYLEATHCRPLAYVVLTAPSPWQQQPVTPTQDKGKSSPTYEGQCEYQGGSYLDKGASARGGAR